jgi:molecular chaperone DnaJ
VRIPPGVGDGSQVRLPGAGNAGRRGGPPGDFVLTVEVEAHPVFRREGDDLHCVVSVGMVEAAMGGHVEVPTPDGEGDDRGAGRHAEWPALPPAQAGRAPPRGGGRGDLWVEARVVIPAATDDRARALLRELSAVLPRS